MKITARQARQAHRRLAIFLGLFLAIHFATHFTAIGGIEAHTQALGLARFFYQFPLFEIALVAGFGAQLIVGAKLLGAITRRKHQGFWHWVQLLSAVYLAFFVVIHTSAALITRLALDLDTNFYWAAGTLRLEPIRYVFAPYYTFAVVALFSHIIAALNFRGGKSWHAPALIIGPVTGIVMVMGFGGVFETINLPQDYRDYFSAFPGVREGQIDQ